MNRQEEEEVRVIARQIAREEIKAFKKKEISEFKLFRPAKVPAIPLVAVKKMAPLPKKKK